MTDIDVLKKYEEIIQKNWGAGWWIEYVPVEILANELNTSKYQIRKAFHSLKEKGYMGLEKICTYSEEYDNGLYCETVPILFAKAYIITEKGVDFLKKEKDKC